MRKNDLKNLDKTKYAALSKKRCKSFGGKGGNHQSDNTYWALFEKSKNPLLMIDGSFRFIKCNVATLKLLGAVSKSQVINRVLYRIRDK